MVARLVTHCVEFKIKSRQTFFPHFLPRFENNPLATLPDTQAGFRKGRGTRDQIANICWIIEKARKFQKNIYFCFIDYAKVFDCVDHNKLWKILKEMGIPENGNTAWETYMQIRKQQLELDMEQQTGSK